MSDYPLMLYRDGGEFVWDGRAVDSMIVEDEDGEKAALKDGWVRSFEDAPAKADKEPAGDDIKDLRAEYKAKFGKAPFNGWDAETLKAKLAE